MDNRRQRQKEVKKKIEQILLSVKEEKQHIQNQLARNDHKIQIYCQEYEQLREQNDFGENSLTQNQRIILQELQQGLMQNMIDPQKVLGSIASTSTTKSRKGSSTNPASNDQFSYRQMTNQQIIKVQTLLLDKLASKISQYDTKSSTF